MNAVRHLPIAVGLCSVVLICATPSQADDPCEDAATNVALIVRLLNDQIPDRAPVRGATFRVISGKDLEDGQPASFTITYGTVGKTLATVVAPRMTPPASPYSWWGYPILNMRAKGGTLDIKWDSGGSQCCACSYLVVRQGGEFKVTPADLPRGRFDQ